jgi:hypothetical protein
MLFHSHYIAAAENRRGKVVATSLRSKAIPKPDMAGRRN